MQWMCATHSLKHQGGMRVHSTESTMCPCLCKIVRCGLHILIRPQWAGSPHSCLRPGAAAEKRAKKKMDAALVVALVLLGLLVARANHLFGRSAHEAGEYGGPFVPTFASQLYTWIATRKN